MDYRNILNKMSNTTIPITVDFIDKVSELWLDSNVKELIKYITDYCEKFLSNTSHDEIDIILSKFSYDTSSIDAFLKLSLDVEFIIDRIIQEEIKYPIENRTAYEWFDSIARLDYLYALELFEQKIYPKIKNESKIKSFVYILSEVIVDKLDAQDENFLSKIKKIETYIVTTYRRFNESDKKTGAVFLQNLAMKLINSNYDEEANNLIERHSKVFPMRFGHILTDAITTKNPDIHSLIAQRKELIKQLEHMKAFPYNLVIEYLEDVRENLLIAKHFASKEKIEQYLEEYNLSNMKNKPEHLLKAISEFLNLKDILYIFPYREDLVEKMVTSPSFQEYCKLSPELKQFQETMRVFNILIERGDHIFREGNQHIYMFHDYSIIDVETSVEELDYKINEELTNIVNKKIRENPFAFDYNNEELEKGIIQKLFDGNRRIYDDLIAFDIKSTEYIFNKVVFQSSHEREEFEKFGSIKEFLFTAEWLWQNNEYVRKNSNKFPGIDMSYQVASYFKVVEILLCKKLGVISDGCRYIYRNKNKELKPDRNKVIGNLAYYQKSTMGLYYNFIKDYKDIKVSSPDFYPSSKDPIINPQKRSYIVRECKKWTEKYRNVLSHKGKVNKDEYVNTIRETTKSLIVIIMKELKGFPQ